MAIRCYPVSCELSANLMAISRWDELSWSQSTNAEICRHGVCQLDQFRGDSVRSAIISLAAQPIEDNPPLAAYVAYYNNKVYLALLQRSSSLNFNFLFPFPIFV